MATKTFRMNKFTEHIDTVTDTDINIDIDIDIQTENKKKIEKSEQRISAWQEVSIEMRPCISNFIIYTYRCKSPHTIRIEINANSSRMHSECHKSKVHLNFTRFLSSG